ncbi:MAG: VOC family protein [Pseudomonadota bacterium]|nr:VOC family protein [Pseudomonadota bacterium]
MFELDHLLVLTDFGAPAADALRSFGLAEGSSNRHPGQGTANRRFYFANTMLELLWVVDAEEAAAAPVSRTGLLSRWRGRGAGACPFGVSLRPCKGAATQTPPFDYWPYRPAYLPPGGEIEMAEGSENPRLPLLFNLPFRRRVDAGQHPEPIDHPAGLGEITSVELSIAQGVDLSPALRMVGDWGIVRFKAGNEPLMVLGFDGVPSGESFDFRPGLPLAFRW